MADFNLIPGKYLEGQCKRKVLVTWASICGATLLAVLIATWALEQHVSANEQSVIEMRDKRALSMQQHASLTQLKATKDSLANKARLLESLRSGAPMTDLIATIEAALSGSDVWFVNWKFLRAGIVAEDDPIARPPSYFVIAGEQEKFPHNWHNLTHMTIHGEAKDHAALSEFVKGLFQQPTVDDVRVQRSAQMTDGISFNLAVVVKNPRSET